jgi:hypothetical protein
MVKFKVFLILILLRPKLDLLLDSTLLKLLLKVKTLSKTLVEDNPHSQAQTENKTLLSATKSAVRSLMKLQSKPSLKKVESASVSNLAKLPSLTCTQKLLPQTQRMETELAWI